MKEKGKAKTAFVIVLVVAIVVVGLCAPVFLSDQHKEAIQRSTTELVGYAADLAVSVGLSSCDIKGNVSYYSGERIYHVRGQEDYSGTRIDWMNGERWFCTQEEAQAAGWRRARN
ncbi:MAG: sunset domain-containing protein [Methylophilaceae bacterium]